MSIAGRVGRNTFYLFISSGLSKVLSLVFIIYIARKLGVLRFGQFSLANSLVQIVIVLADLGLTMLAVREIAREREKTAALIGQWGPFKLILSGLTLAVIFLVAEILNYPLKLKVIIYLFAFYYLLYSMAAFFRSVFLAWEKMQYDALITMAEKAFIVSLGLLAVYLGYGVLALAIIYIAGGILNLGITYFFLKKRFVVPEYSFKKRFYWSSLKSAYPFALSALLTMVFLYIDTVMLSKMRSPEEVGWYSAGFNLVHQLRIFASVFLGAAFPVLARLAKESPASLKDLYSQGSRFLLPLAIPLAVGGIILARPLIISFFGPEYTQAITVFKILVWTMPILYLNGFFGYLMASLDKQHLLLSYLIVATMANVIVNFIFIPRYGAIAAAWASVMAEIIFFSFCWGYWQRHFRTYAILNYLFPIALASAIMAVALKLFISLNIFWLVLMGLVIYGAMLLILGYFKKEDWGSFLNILKAR